MHHGVLQQCHSISLPRDARETKTRSRVQRENPASLYEGVDKQLASI